MDAHPQTMTVTGKNTVTINDILVGDVWLCSGQSNMTYRLAFDGDLPRRRDRRRQ